MGTQNLLSQEGHWGTGDTDFRVAPRSLIKQMLNVLELLDLPWQIIEKGIKRLSKVGML